MSANSQAGAEYLHPGLLRRLAAIFYDAILLLAIIMICFIPVPLLPDPFRAALAGKLLLQGYILLILFLFFGWFWTHRGQTLGMRAWRLKVVSHDGTAVSWLSAARRFFLALISFAAFGLGYLICLFHSENMTFHDLFSGTKIVIVEKKNKKFRRSAATETNR